MMGSRLGGGACWAAGAEGACPAAARRICADLGGGLAAVPGDVRPAVPAASAFPGGGWRCHGGCRASDLRPGGPRVHRVRCIGRSLRRGCPGSGSAAVPAPGLAPGGGQAVGAFHAVDVAVAPAGSGRRQRRRARAAVTQPRQRIRGRRSECLREQVGRGEAAADGGGDPAVGVIEGPRRGDQVQDRVLHRRPRQLPGRLPPRHQAPRPVDNHPPNVPVPGGVLLGRNADVDLRAGLVGQAVNLGGGLVADHGAGPYAEHRGPQFRLSRRSPVKVA